jgi:hypothetical protein
LINYTVYCLFDPFDYAAIYIGRGRRHRCHVHNAFARSRRPASEHGNIGLIERLRAGLAWGFEAPAVELFTHLTADQHIGVERVWIKALGRRDLGTGRLYNLNDGTPDDEEPGLRLTRCRPMPVSMQVTPLLRKRNPELVSRVRTPRRAKVKVP